MNASGIPSDAKDEKPLPQLTLQTVPQNLTTIQAVQSSNTQNIQNVVTSNLQNIQTIPGSAIVGKQLILKSPISPNIVSSVDNNKITNAVRILI